MMRLRLLAILPLLGGLAAANPDTFDSFIVKARDAYAEGKFDDAVTYFAKARQVDESRWEGHTGQALALIQRALQEQGSRRKATTHEAEAMTAQLVKKCGILFQHPLRLYIVGVCASVRGELERAVSNLRKAHAAPETMFKPFKSIELHLNVRRAYGRSLLDYGKRTIVHGKWSAAQPMLDRAQRVLPKDDPRRADLERSLAVLDEAFNRWESAIERLRKCIKIARKDNLELRHEFLGTIALIYFKNERHEDGVKALKDVSKDSKHPRILMARCTAMMLPALRGDRKDPLVDETLAYFRKAMATFPKDELHGLVEDYTKVVLHKVGVREAQKERALLEDNIRRLQIELKLRPECPSTYFLLYQLYKLMGDAKKEVEYEALHKRKRAEFKNKAQFDSRGRPRCR